MIDKVLQQILSSVPPTGQDHDVSLNVDTIDSNLIGRPYILNEFFRMHFGYPCQHSNELLPGTRYLKKLGFNDIRIKIHFESGHSCIRRCLLRESESKDGKWITSKMDIRDIKSPVRENYTLGDAVADYLVSLGFRTSIWIMPMDEIEDTVSKIWKQTDIQHDVILTEFFRMHFGYPCSNFNDLCPGTRFLMDFGFNRDLRLRVRFRRIYPQFGTKVMGLEGSIEKEGYRDDQWSSTPTDIKNISLPLFPSITIGKAVELYFIHLGFPEPFWKISGENDVKHFYNAVIENWIQISKQGHRQR